MGLFLEYFLVGIVMQVAWGEQKAVALASN